MLTPVDFREGMYWKRDDLYKPFGDYHVNGGKVRQALQLFETKIDVAIVGSGLFKAKDIIPAINGPKLTPNTIGKP